MTVLIKEFISIHLFKSKIIKMKSLNQCGRSLLNYSAIAEYLRIPIFSFRYGGKKTKKITEEQVSEVVHEFERQLLKHIGKESES